MTDPGAGTGSHRQPSVEHPVGDDGQDGRGGREPAVLAICQHTEKGQTDGIQMCIPQQGKGVAGCSPDHAPT
jgi:hypothetical protein